MRATILTEEHAPQGSGLQAEHGLAVFVEAGEARVLFDTGCTQVCVENAGRLGVDLAAAQRIVLSHGHYDHTGGLAAVLQAIGPREVVAHPAVFGERHAQRPSESRPRPVGPPSQRTALEALGASFRLESGPTQVGDGITVTGAIPRHTAFEGPSPHLFVGEGEARQADPFEDDQALVVSTSRGPVVVLGCAHAGVVNTLTYAAQIAGSPAVYAVAGGMHLGAASDDRIEQTIRAMRDLGVERVMPCHCTGGRAAARMADAFGAGCIPCAVGTSFEIE